MSAVGINAQPVGIASELEPACHTRGILSKHGAAKPHQINVKKYKYL